MKDELAVVIGAATSLGLHAALGIALASGPEPTRQRLPPTAVSIEVVPPVPTAAMREAALSKTRENAPSTQANRIAPIKPVPTARSLPDRAATRAPIDLSGITLTGDGTGVSWSVPVERSVSGDPPRRSELRAAALERAATPPEPRSVKVADLSKKSTPPALAAALARRYPAELRRRAVEGDAVVRARIDPDGLVRVCSVVSETEPGFGEACRQTVLGSHWGAPLDRNGRPVSTEIRYSCRFRIER